MGALANAVVSVGLALVVSRGRMGLARWFVAALAVGTWLLLRNPAFDKHAVIASLPVLNELLLAYGIPALLAALLARAAASAWPSGFREVLAAYAAASDRLLDLLIRHLADEEDLVIPAMLEHGERSLA
mgnify:CR=1 FL=1